MLFKGTAQADSGNLTLTGANWQNQGRLKVTGGAVYVSGTWDNSGYTYDIGAGGNTGNLSLLGGTITGGVITSSTGAKLVASDTSTLSNVTLNTDLDIGSSGTVNVADTLTVNAGKTVNMGNGGNLYFTGAGTTPLLTGLGTLSFNASPGSAGQVQSTAVGSTLTVDSGITVKTGTNGSGTLGAAGKGMLFKGTAQADTGSLTFTGTNWQNQGVIESTGGYIGLQGTNWQNTASGKIVATSGTVNLGNLPANDGLLETGPTGTIATGNSSLTNSATGIIRGTGVLDLGYTSSSSPTATVYTLGTLTNNGTIDPGVGVNGTGTLTVKGNLEMGATGKLHIDLAGTGAGQYDQLSFVGITSPAIKTASVTLDGTLDIGEVGASVSGGFFADKGNAFPNLVTANGGASGLNGGFNTIATPSPGDLAFNFAVSGVPGITGTTASTTRWATDSSGTWAMAANWSRGVPTAGKDAVISRASNPVITVDTAVVTPSSLVLDESLTLASGGSLALPTGVTSYNQTLKLTGGTLRNPNALTLSGNLLLESGAIIGAGALTLAPGASLSKSTTGTATLGQTLNNQSTVTVSGGQLNLAAGGVQSGSFDVASGSTLNFAGGTQQFSDGSRFTNAGTFTRTGGTVALTGTGSGLTVDAATTLDLTNFAFTGSGVLTNQGTVNGSNASFGGKLLNAGIANLGNGTNLVGGFVNSGTGVMNITAGNVTSQGATAELAGGSINLQNGASLTQSSGLLNWSGGAFNGSGTLAFTNGGLIGFSGSGDRTLNNPNLNFSFTDLTLPSGSLTLRAGNLNLNTTVSGSTNIPATTTLAMYGGTMTNNGPMNVGGSLGLYGGTLNGAGALNITGGTIDMPDTSTVVWAATGVFNNTGTLSLSNRTITNAITNNGVINTTGGLTFTQLFTNQGGYNQNSGSSNFNSGFLQTAGTTRLGTSVSAPGNMTVGGAGYQMNGGSLGGSGTLTGNLNIAAGTLAPGYSPGSLTVAGNLNLAPSSVTTIELGGTAAGTGYDQINVTGTANLGGTLNLNQFGAFVPVAGNTFDYMTFASSTGNFAAVNFNGAASGWGLTNNLFASSLQMTMPAVAIAPLSSSGPSTSVVSSMAANSVLWSSFSLASGSGASAAPSTSGSTAGASLAGVGNLAASPQLSGTSVAILDITPATGLSGSSASAFGASAAGSASPASTGAATANSATTGFGTATMNNLPGYRYLISDTTNLYFRVLPLADMEMQDLGMVLQSRKAYKQTLFASAIKQLEKNPALPDLPGCSNAVTALSGNCVYSADKSQAISPLASSKPGVENASLAKALPQIARKVAVVIGLNRYDDKRIPQLIGALSDAKAVTDTLKDQMGYEVVLLKDPTKQEIFSALNGLAAEVKENDSMLVYFAGHGEMVESTGLGYWIPRDANADDPKGWFSNADLNRLLASSKSRQIAVVADSCYSGVFAKEAEMSLTNSSTNLQDLLQKRAVAVMSSGGDEPVADTGKDGKSVFAYNLMENIKKVNTWASGGSLFDSVRTAVERELPQTPQYGASVSAGHETGADYLFERRTKATAVR